MDVYILKFSACLALFVFFYKLFLENQQMHRFKRVYLLAAIVFAFSVPFITFTEYVEPVQPIESFQTSFEPVFIPQIVEEPQVNYLPIVLWSLYGLGVLLFSVKFILNLIRIFNKIRKNETNKSQSFIYVLLNDLVIPHSFFSYIFLNKEVYKTEQIPNEVLIHEQTHAKQKHSIDVLLIELLQIVFWFHPLVYIIKHAIKLNHEFLADEAVINQGVEPSAYQQLLIAFSSNASKKLPIAIGMASAINYSSIKKRFTVMKTNTSKRSIWLRSIVLLPLIAFSIYGFSEKKEVVKELVSNEDDSQQNIHSVVNTDTISKKRYYENVTFIITDNNGNEVKKTYSELTEEEVLSLLPPFNPMQKIPNKENIDNWKDSKTYGVWIDEKRVENKVLKNYSPSDFSLFNVSKLEKNAVNYGKHYFQVSLYTNKKYKELYGNGSKPFGKGATIKILSEKVKEDYKDINGKKGKVIKSGEWSDVENYLKEGVQEKATKEEIEEYNKLAKHCNVQLKTDVPIIKVKEVNRVKYLFDKMSNEQKKNAEPYPDFSKIPTLPTPASTSKENKSSKSKDLQYREAILRLSMNQKVPLTYKLNDEKSTIEAIQSYILKNPESDVSFTNDNENVLHFSDNKGKKMSYEEFQKVYSSVFANYNQDTTKTKFIYYKVDNESCLKFPKSFDIKNGNTLKVECIEQHSKNRLQIFTQAGELVFSEDNYANDWDGTLDEEFAKDIDKLTSGKYLYVFDYSNLKLQMAGLIQINYK